MLFDGIVSNGFKANDQSASFEKRTIVYPVKTVQCKSRLPGANIDNGAVYLCNKFPMTVGSYACYRLLRLECSSVRNGNHCSFERCPSLSRDNLTHHFSLGIRTLKREHLDLGAIRDVRNRWSLHQR